MYVAQSATLHKMPIIEDLSRDIPRSSNARPRGGGARPTYEAQQELWETLQTSRIVGQAGNPHPWSANQVQGGPRSDYGQKRAKVITLHPFLPRQGHLEHLPAAAITVMSMFILSASEKCH